METRLDSVAMVNKISPIKNTPNFDRQSKQSQLEAPNDEANRRSEVTKEQVEEGVEILNNAMEYFHHKLHFEVHEGTNRIKVAVVDPKNDEIIKEIPPEEVLDMLAKIQDMLGLLVDKRA